MYISFARLAQKYAAHAATLRRRASMVGVHGIHIEKDIVVDVVSSRAKTQKKDDPLTMARRRLSLIRILKTDDRVAATKAICMGCEFAKKENGVFVGCVACGCGEGKITSRWSEESRYMPMADRQRDQPCPRDKWPKLFLLQYQFRKTPSKSPIFLSVSES